ncbi:MAG: PKD domain-containing protein [Flavobacteriales bacterium]|nr:PKD domain-containing protein [Flavobacteriales bacterium]
MRLPLTILGCLLGVVVEATHIIGGNMYYDHLGGSQYRVTLVLYRDCGPDNANGTGFDASAILAVFNSSGGQVTSANVPYAGEVPLPVELNDPCLTAPPTVCVRTAVYETVFNLPPVAGGYTVSYQRCCRTPAMANLAGQQGITCTASIPGPPLAQNSSPRFGDIPAIAICVGQEMMVDFSATDPDGDALVYELCAPFTGGTAFDPAPFPDPPPYSPVGYSAGYSAADPVDSDPPMSIDPSTGLLQIAATAQGVYTVGVCVTEVRDGVTVGVTRGDFLFKVVVCDAEVLAVVAEQGEAALCVGLTQEFENESVNGVSWAWDFGDPNITTDVSSLQEPVWTYAQPGIYTVRLIANPGSPCADTSFQTYDMQAPMDIWFERPQILCPGEEAVLSIAGIFGPDADFEWETLGAAGSGTAFPVAYAAPGTYAVSVSGVEGACADSFVDSVVVLAAPIPGLFVGPDVCVGGKVELASTSVSLTPLTYEWFINNELVSTDSAFSWASVIQGSYAVSLTVRTDSGCIAERTIDAPAPIEAFPLPMAAFVVDPLEVSLLDPEVMIEDRSQDAVAWTYVVEGRVFEEPDLSYTFTDGGRRVITLTVESENGCVDTTSRVVTVSDHLLYIPTAFTPDGDGLNDVWQPSVRGARLYELQVFDRWGQLVFSTTDPRAGWAGDGAGEGLYNYVVRLAEFGADRKEYRGHFTLLR